jgi:Ca-activated chloride channel family protein
MSTRNQTQSTELMSADGQAVSLKSVHIEGRLDGLMLTMKSRQTYRNTAKVNLETVYTFPLPWGETLMALRAEIDGHRLAGTVMEKTQAMARYEQAIDDGDTPIMVERSARGLYTANLGNLKPGEEAVIEIEHAQLLRFEQGQIRITVPTTVAPRYGDAHAAGGLAAHESVDASMLVEYPLTLQILLTGDAARAAVHSPSHAIATTARDDGTLVSATHGAFLDRDLVVLIEGLASLSFATVVPDGEAFAVLASFCPDMAPQARDALRLSVLVDCSGSMGGDSIGSARKALHEVLKELAPADCITYSRFGSDVVHHLKKMQACDEATIRAVAGMVSGTEADMGGTQMHAALLSTFKLDDGAPWGKPRSNSNGQEHHTDVLLITDGELWAVDDVVEAARRSGHRVFAIGVGSAPAESLLRELAQSTGGACELLAPKQDLAGVILRMFHRLRTPRTAGLRLDWGQSVEWQDELPNGLFGGDTVHVFARLAQAPQRPPVLSWSSAEGSARATADRWDVGTGDTLARMAGAMQLASLGRPRPGRESADHGAAALKLALQYQLVTEQTNLILVHLRAEGQKAAGLPELAQIAHMQAAGWGGASTVMERAQSSGPLFSMRETSPSSIRYHRGVVPRLASLASGPGRGETVQAAAAIVAISAKSFDSLEVPAFLNKDVKSDDQGGIMTPMEVLQVFDACALVSGGAAMWMARLDALHVPKKLALHLEAMVLALGSREQAWGIVLHWLGQALAGEFTLSRQAARIVRSSIKPVDAATLQRWTDALALAMGPVQANAWGKANETA